MKKYFSIITLLIVALFICSSGYCQPVGALKGYYPASGTFKLLTVDTPTSEVPVWPFSYPTGTALGFYPASSTYHPLIVDADGRLAIDSDSGVLWEVDPAGGIKPIDDEIVNMSGGMTASATSYIQGLEVLDSIGATDITLTAKVKAAWAEITGNIYASGTLTVDGNATIATSTVSVGLSGDAQLTVGGTTSAEVIIRCTDRYSALGLKDAGGYSFQLYSDSYTGKGQLSVPTGNTMHFGIQGAETLNLVGSNVLIGTTTDNGYRVAAAGGSYMFSDGRFIVGNSDDGMNKLQVNGFTKLGDAATGVKTEYVTGTTAAAEGGSTSVAFTANSEKIVGLSVLVNYLAGAQVPPGNPSAGYTYSYSTTTNEVTVVLSATESENILSKPIKVLIWYVE